MKSTSGNATPTSPASSTSSGGKMIAVRVQMLDDSITLFHIQAKVPGRVLFDQVCKQLNLLEVDYFGLEYEDTHGVMYWLDLEKQMNHQVGLTSSEPLLRFCVKFYTPDPTQIEEEYTRYLFTLQVKRDLGLGLLQCNDNTAALMASYIVQAECGDYVVEDYPDHTYLSSFKFVPQQNQELERKIMENHKRHIGQNPAEADLNLLETGRRCELYGIKMHSAKDHEGVTLELSVAHIGVVVFQNQAKINTFSWAKIRKLSFKRKKFLIKLHPEGYGYYKDTVEFYFEDRNHCKNFWKKCVEHHSFFRCSTTIHREREKRRLLSRGSSFRYSGKTQKEMQEFVRENFVQRQSFQRHVRNLHSSMGNVGTSISAQPLLPIGDNGVDTTDNRFEGRQEPLNEEGIQRYLDSSEDVYKRVIVNQPPPKDVTYSPTNNNYNTEPSRDQRNQTPTSGSYNLDEGRATETMSSLSSPFSGPPGNNYSGHHTTTTIAGAPSPLKFIRDGSVDGTLSPVSSKSGGTDTDLEFKKKKYPVDRTYFITKEILMTERTYKKDLEIINLWFRDEVTKEEDMPEELLTLIFSHFDPIYEAHCRLLNDIEQNMIAWEKQGSTSTQSSEGIQIGSLVLRTFDVLTLDHYLRYLEAHVEVLEVLESTLANDSRFSQVFKDFEAQKVCYLPVTSLLLKPLHRIIHYDLLLERLLQTYNSNHPDYQNANMVMIKMQTVIRKMSQKLLDSENFAKLAELQRDVGSSFEGVLSPHRHFIREGCLLKLSRKGYQQRMFFLFSDMLLYSNRTTTPSLHFRVHGQLFVKDLSVLESEPRMGADHCFNIYDGKKAILVAAGSQAEKIQWMEDISDAIQVAKENDHMNGDSGYNNGSSARNKFMSLKSISGSDDGLDKAESHGTLDTRSGSSSTGQRTNSSVHVCWHRSTTMSAKEYHTSIQTLLSGYLLRKFKNSNGWQKLWVVFTNSCLFFYKTFQDDFPLASLPLLGYGVFTPTPEDEIQKNFVFKLQFKNHVYFFRAESQYTFERWIEVLSTSTQVELEVPVHRNGY
ncbi:FERM, ARHGEF and pleckstrin domain-containing protein 2-like [Tigriopus californicus]|uniref:FERM, ARHGEF and pleckstrin domain-containing protein 2-like n=1 Tax=Tigriopus californicus TaxID=6832 RepID=UPI0027DA6B96|nr:FERM, ARHGEF and pleckstrin domain-containing protein 2-like [Tigriopus californicus]|eukprot:TCALIF_06432-PA protein Name:"Similar to FARP2 FERM, RhoGEF and pleckstrin domain-containing protein 2 (Homo sapiens)" AED:0.07 eAED:0.07 QI:318/1/0.94/1/0.88/0.94/19/347/1043